jgi:enoyl-[acyl-carrier protein] reductase III
LESLIRYLGTELAPLNIVVNGVSPGIVLTDALTHFASFRAEGDDLIAEAISRTPAGRLCTPADVAELVCFLCGPAARMMCGQTIILDGGQSLLAR